MRVCGVFGGTPACSVSSGVKDWACWIVARTSCMRYMRTNLDVQGRIRVHWYYEEHGCFVLPSGRYL